MISNYTKILIQYETLTVWATLISLKFFLENSPQILQPGFGGYKLTPVQPPEAHTLQ
jgi:hypothetical protein